MLFNQLRTFRLPDMLSFFGLLCVSFSVYFSFKGFLVIAYFLILTQFLLDYFDGKLARAIRGKATVGKNQSKKLSNGLNKKVIEGVAKRIAYWF